MSVARASHPPPNVTRANVPALKPAPNPLKSARAAGLRYVNLDAPGPCRRKIGEGFIYHHPSGRRIVDAQTLARIRSLVIPPAWTDVWICPHADGHIQAIGRDAAGRKQYRYHPRFREVRDQAKYGRLLAFAAVLPRIRRRVAGDLRRPGLPRQKVLAAIVRLLETTFMRVGNEEYANRNHSYGLTTIRNHHVEVRGARIHFEFRGKSGKEHEIDLEDAPLARIVRRCQELPEQELFEYIDEHGVRRDITSSDVNAYLREITAGDFSAKDFRTWAGTVLAATALAGCAPFESQAQARRNLVACIERVAQRLGNTKAVCRKCYIHPAVVDCYLAGALPNALRPANPQLKALTSLRQAEIAVVALLKRQPHRAKSAMP
jgi:DNA topoisomerase-1